MPLIGLIGGVSPKSTPIYYELIHAAYQAARGGSHSAPLLIYSVDFDEIVTNYNKRDWAGYADVVVNAARHLKAGGATHLAICSNTTHLAAEAAVAETGLPLIHLQDCLAGAMRAQNVRRPLLLGTDYVMRPGQYRDDLGTRFDGDVAVPAENDLMEVNRIIFEELMDAKVKIPSQVWMQQLVERFGQADCDGVILGCTELCLILDQGGVSLPVFDTTAIHARAIADVALGKGV